MAKHFFAVMCALWIVAYSPAQLKQKEASSHAEILWDRWGVPHIYAKDINGAARAFALRSHPLTRLQNQGELQS
jgi:acyl-homoserine lactone acylase PvdQ